LAFMTCSGSNILPFHVHGMELNLCHFPDDVFHVFGSHGQDTCVLKLDVFMLSGHG
jgi:hypothetical protein